MVRILAVVAVLAGLAHAGITWERDFEKAKARALKEDKLIFIDFYADW
jgi:hypothetical protein